jgi:DNA polymerase-3 subunit epsilon
LSSHLREVVFDTETTGLSPRKDRIVEIGCVELVNHVPTGKTFHSHINPGCEMPTAAFDVHGLSAEFLSDKPIFADVADDFIAFLGDAPVIAHNAGFDVGFVREELKRLGRPNYEPAVVIDTVAMARKKFPGAQASLDALCRRFEIDLSAREKHGALLDAELLAAVYLELIGGRQQGLNLTSDKGAEKSDSKDGKSNWPARVFSPTPEEESAHQDFVATHPDAVWSK